MDPLQRAANAAHAAVSTLYGKLVEQDNLIASLRKSNDELTVLVSSQDYDIKKLKAQIADYKDAAAAQAGRASSNAIGVEEVAKFESKEAADDQMSLYEKMAQRKEALAVANTPAATRQRIIELARRASAPQPPRPQLAPNRDIDPTFPGDDYLEL